MPDTPRHTLAAPATIEGVGLFTGRDVHCTIQPAEPGTGLCFRRTDLPDAPTIPAAIACLGTKPVHPAFAQISPRHTSVVSADHPDAIVYTTEHVLGALVGIGVTDTVIELDSAELPIGDGSAQLFADAIRSAGLRETGDPIAPLTLDTPVTVTSPDGSSTITVEPIGAEETPLYRYELDYGPSLPIPAQVAEWTGKPGAFLEHVAPARTFSLAIEAQQMQALGLFRRFSPTDLLVIDDQGMPIDNAWRGEHEPARHKLLDLIGDLSLVGRPIHARITATRAGHALNHAMARALVAAATG